MEYRRSRVSSRKLPALGRWGNVPGNGLNLDASHVILRTREIASQFQETSRNGAMEERSRKGSNLDASHSILWNMGEHMSIPGNFPQWGGAMEERSGEGENLKPISRL